MLVPPTPFTDVSYSLCSFVNFTFPCAGFAGTPGYLSPEVLRKDPYGKPVDIWACGESSGLGDVHPSMPRGARI